MHILWLFSKKGFFTKSVYNIYSDMLVEANHYGKFYTEQMFDNIHNKGNPLPAYPQDNGTLQSLYSALFGVYMN